MVNGNFSAPTFFISGLRSSASRLVLLGVVGLAGVDSAGLDWPEGGFYMRALLEEFGGAQRCRGFGGREEDGADEERWLVRIKAQNKSKFTRLGDTFLTA